MPEVQRAADTIGIRSHSLGLRIVYSSVGGADAYGPTTLRSTIQALEVLQATHVEAVQLTRAERVEEVREMGRGARLAHLRPSRVVQTDTGELVPMDVPMLLLRYQSPMEVITALPWPLEAGLSGGVLLSFLLLAEKVLNFPLRVTVEKERLLAAKAKFAAERTAAEIEAYDLVAERFRFGHPFRVADAEVFDLDNGRDEASP
jgi:hypothetical protein